jgi:hypothetical protein
MVRLLLLFFLFFLFFVVLNLYLFRRKRPRDLSADAATAEELVLDPQCKTYLPKTEAMLRGEEYFCSEQCARLYLAGRSS